MKSKAMKKFLALMLTAATVLSMTACGGSASGEANVSGLDENGNVREINFPLEETAELSFITSAPANSTQNPNEREIFKRLEEQTNVHVEWTCFVEDQFNDKKNLAMSQAKSLPDGLFNARKSNYDLLRYAKQGVIISVEDLIKSICRICRLFLKSILNIKRCVLRRMGIFIHFRGLNSWVKERKQSDRLGKYILLIKSGWMS